MGTSLGLFSHSVMSNILCNPMDCSMPGFPVLHYLLEWTQTPVHWANDTIQSSHPEWDGQGPLLLLPSIFPSIKISSNESVLCKRWPKYWSSRISSLDEDSGLISFRIDWFDILIIQGTLKSLLQHHNSKLSIFLHSTFLWSRGSCIHRWLLEKP